MDTTFRSKMIRLAASMPKGSNERKALLDVLAGRGPDPKGRNWIKKSNPSRWVWVGSAEDPAFTVTEHEAPFGLYYKLQILLPDGSMFKTHGQKTDKEHWFMRAAKLYRRWGSAGGFDLSMTPERWSRMA